MLRIENPNTFRENIANEILKIIPKEKYAKNVERGVYNFSIMEAEKKNIVKKWDNIYFVQHNQSFFQFVSIAAQM